MENITIGIIFIGAVAYLIKQLRNSLNSKNSGCAKNCGGACSAKFDIVEKN